MKTDYTCPRCAKTAFPYFTLSSKNKLVVQCPNPGCCYEDESLCPADFNQGVAAMPSEGAAAGPGWSGKVAVAVQDASAPAYTPSAVAPIQYAPAPPTAPADVIGMIEQRAAWLQQDEARLEGVIAEAKATLAGRRAERKSLSRMLTAASARHTSRQDFVPARAAMRDVAINFKN